MLFECVITIVHLSFLLALRDKPSRDLLALAPLQVFCELGGTLRC